MPQPQQIGLTLQRAEKQGILSFQLPWMRQRIVAREPRRGRQHAPLHRTERYLHQTGGGLLEGHPADHYIQPLLQQIHLPIAGLHGELHLGVLHHKRGQQTGKQRIGNGNGHADPHQTARLLLPLPHSRLSRLRLGQHRLTVAIEHLTGIGQAELA